MFDPLSYLMGAKAAGGGGGGGGSDAVPSGYTRVLYAIVSNGNGIDTGITVSDKITVEAAFMSKDMGNTMFVIGPGYGFIGISAKQNDLSAYMKTKSATKSGAYGAFNDKAWDIIVDKTGMSVNGEKIAFQSDVPEFIESATVTLFVNNSTLTSQSNAFGGKCFYVGIWDGEEKVRNFVPAVRDADGICGLYDTVGGAFYVSGGPTNYSAGPEINTLVF